jgi:hypothetical protein
MTPVKIIEIDPPESLLIFDSAVTFRGNKIFLESTGNNEQDRKLRSYMIDMVNDRMDWIQ